MIDYVLPGHSIFHNNELDDVYEQLYADMSYFENRDSVVNLMMMSL